MTCSVSRLRVYHEVNFTVNFEILFISHPSSELSAAASWIDLPIIGVQELPALESKIVGRKVNGRNDDFLSILAKITQNGSQAKEKRLTSVDQNYRKGQGERFYVNCAFEG